MISGMHEWNCKKSLVIGNPESDSSSNEVSSEEKRREYRCKELTWFGITHAQASLRGIRPVVLVNSHFATPE